MQNISVETSGDAAHLTSRLVLAVEIALAVALTAYALVRYPAAVTLSPIESTIYLAVFAILVIGYSWFGLRRSTPSFVLRQGLFFGIVVGLLWIIELAAGNLNFSNAAWAIIPYRTSMLAVMLVTLTAGALGARRTGQVAAGTMIGLWSGMISGLITFIALMLIAYLFQSGLQTVQENVLEFLRSGAPDFATYSVADSLVGAINHLWIGPFLGILLGTVGGVVGKSLAEAAE